MDYRTWLAQQAKSHPDENTRKQAAAVLQRVGNDRKLDEGWLNNPLGFVLGRTDGYGKQSIVNMNDNFSGMYDADMKRIASSPIVHADGTDPYATANGTENWGTPTPGTGLVGGGGYDPYAAAERQRIQERNALRGQISGRGSEIEDLYSAMFGDLESLISSRDAELEAQYGDQFKKATDQYTSAIPEIETSYAAIGAADSTDQSDAKDTAKFGFDDTTKQIGENKKSDKTKLGNYAKETRTRLTEDRDTARRELGRANETEDVGALRALRDSIEGNLSKGRVTRSTLGTDGSARDEITRMTGDSGRFDQAINALDSVLKSSMSGSVKEAAVQAVVDNAGLSDEEKKKVQQQYGNVYAEQAAL